MNARHGKKSLISVILGLSMIVSACSSSTGDKAASQSEGSEDSKPYEVVMAYPAYGETADVGAVQQAINDITSKKINATVKLIPIPLSNYANQMRLMLAGREKLDVVYTTTWIGFSSQVASGQLLPLDELVNKYGQGIEEAVGKEFAEAGKIKGVQYAIPSVKGWALTPSLMMSKALVEKHGIDISKMKSWADVAPVLEKIKVNEPGVTPLVSYSPTNNPAFDMLYFDPLGTDPGILPFEGTDFHVINKYESKIYADVVNQVRNWYVSGYMSKDIATTQELGPTLIKSGKAFSFIRNINDCFSEQIAGTELVCAGLSPTYITRNSISSNLISIARNSQNPEKAIQFINLLYTDKDVINLFTNGIEGKHYVKGDNELIKKPDGVASTGYDSNQFIIGNNFLSYIWEGNDPQIWEKMKKLNKESVRSRVLGFSFDIEPVKTELTTVTNVKNQFFRGFETGVTDPQELPAFIEKLKTAGLEKLLAEKQKQLDEWLKTKK